MRGTNTHPLGQQKVSHTCLCFPGVTLLVKLKAEQTSMYFIQPNYQKFHFHTQSIKSFELFCILPFHTKSLISQKSTTILSVSPFGITKCQWLSTLPCLAVPIQWNRISSIQTRCCLQYSSILRDIGNT